jgi:hypothetical protein
MAKIKDPNFANRCNSCKHWKNQQAELEYTTHYGICTCSRWEFSVTGVADVAVLDRDNKSSKHMHIQRFENQNGAVPIGAPRNSRYCFVTEEEFGCIHHEKVKAS